MSLAMMRILRAIVRGLGQGATIENCDSTSFSEGPINGRGMQSSY